MSLQREPARLSVIQMRKILEERLKENPITEPTNKGLLSRSGMVVSHTKEGRKGEAARVADIMIAIRESMQGEG